ncbi:MAG: 2-amino-4-hydroxy-6-hydroxymethyldihydropteridine diphosphokinase [Bacteroidales bacterium]|nr:2-amino-4-hydroxy-6-hydroxymethyldihydropteridine diphosphokinase [Bacteroidales bacterium]
MHKITILLGSNQGNRRDLILRAIQLLETKLGKYLKASSIYESKAWGFEAETTFLNQVLIFETQLKPQEILQISLDIEKVLGRIRNTKGYASRTMDIDLLFYDNRIIEEANLQIPHPRLHLRRFTLEPLVEIIPNFIHPKFKKSMSELLQACPDNLMPNKLEK